MDLMVTVMIVYWVITLLIGYIAGRGAGKSYESFAMAERGLGTMLVFMTYMGAFAGGGLTMGIATLAFKKGISAQWYAMTQGLAFVTMCLIIPHIRKFFVVSVPELIGRAFGLPTRVIAAIITIFGQTMLTAGQTIGMASIITVTTGIPLMVSFVLSAGVFILITYYGGLKSIAWADLFHGILHVGGVVIVIPWLIMEHGGWGALMGSLPQTHLNWFGIGLLQILTWYIMYVVTCGAGQMLVQKVWAARDDKAAVWGVFWSGAFVFIYGIFTAIAGLFALRYAPGIDPKLAYAWTIGHLLPPWAGALILAAAVAAVMSAADAFLLAAGVVFTNDIWIPFRKNCSEGEKVLVSRLAILVVGTVACLIALSGINIIPINTLGMGLMGAPIFTLLMFGLFWKKTPRDAGLVTIILASLGVVVWEVLKHPYNIETTIAGLVVGTITILLYRLFKPNAPDTHIVPDLRETRKPSRPSPSANV